MGTEINLVSLMERYGNDNKCREALEKIRWPEGVACLRCGDMSISRLREYDKYECNSCRYQFTVTAGTIMHGSHLPLRKWFLAIYLMCTSKKGISANQLGGMIGVSYKTAWYLCHRIREAMESGNLDGPTLFGIVEVDETWLTDPRGRKPGDKRKRPPQIYIAGAIQRGGNVRLARVPNLKGKTLKGFIRKHVKDEAEAIYTDNLRSYLGIADENTRHEIISHEWEWVRGDIHTNTIENVWSLLKRSIVGAFHNISVKHLDRYLEELEWRFNNRDNPHIFRDTLRRIVDTGALQYSELTA